MKQKIIPIALVLMVILFAYLRFFGNRPKQYTMRVGGANVALEIADTVGKQRQGLSGRASLPENQGMYFPMGEPSRYVFWMKDMQFPLDIIWIRDGRIVDISENVPYPVGDHVPVSVQSKEPASGVLEVNADFTEKHGTKIGDTVEIADGHPLIY